MYLVVYGLSLGAGFISDYSRPPDFAISPERSHTHDLHSTTLVGRVEVLA